MTKQIDFNLRDSRANLDSMLPRVCSLALNSSDRKTKVAACELLYSTTIYMMGLRSKLNSKIWKHVSATIVDLGCDSDPAVQQMFEPLLFQIVHYLAQPDNTDQLGKLF